MRVKHKSPPFNVQKKTQKVKKYSTHLFSGLPSELKSSPDLVAEDQPILLPDDVADQGEEVTAAETDQNEPNVTDNDDEPFDTADQTAEKISTTGEPILNQLFMNNIFSVKKKNLYSRIKYSKKQSISYLH